jgi:hypothetical protein
MGANIYDFLYRPNIHLSLGEAGTTVAEDLAWYSEALLHQGVQSPKVIIYAR